jgi:hypothetical protein
LSSCFPADLLSRRFSEALSFFLSGEMNGGESI